MLHGSYEDYLKEYNTSKSRPGQVSVREEGAREEGTMLLHGSYEEYGGRIVCVREEGAREEGTMLHGSYEDCVCEGGDNVAWLL